MTETTDRPAIGIDIVSDVVCPWCVVGLLQLEQALARQDLTARIRWHPFELNPAMGPEGQDLREHMAEKYGSTAEQSAQVRTRLTDLGAGLGFAFAFSDASRIYNTFLAHQVLDWAEGQGRQHAVKLALFRAYFSDGLDVSQPEVLLRIVQSVGLDPKAAGDVLASQSHAAPVRRKQQFWTSRGVSAVPTMVFGGKYLVTGAQSPGGYAKVLQRCRDELA